MAKIFSRALPLRIVQQLEAFCLEAGSNDGLRMSYGNQAVIMAVRGRPEEALALLKKEEALCLDLRSKDGWVTATGTWAFLRANK